MRWSWLVAVACACASTTDSGVDADPDEGLWDVVEVDTQDFAVGLQLVAAREGSAAVALGSLYGRDYDVECSEGVLSETDHLVLNLADVTGRLEPRRALELTSPVGSPIDLAIGADGTPWVAASIGESLDGFAYCGPHDLGLGTQSIGSRVSSSGEAPRGDAALDAGRRVGFRPTLAVLGDEPVVVYEDRHDGSGPVDLEVVRGRTNAPTLLARDTALPDDRQLIAVEERLVLRTEGRFRALDAFTVEHTLPGEALGALSTPSGALVAVMRDSGTLYVWEHLGADLSTGWTSRELGDDVAWDHFAALEDGRIVLVRPTAEPGFELRVETGTGDVDSETVALPGEPCSDVEIVAVADTVLVMASCLGADFDTTAPYVFMARRREGL